MTKYRVTITDYAPRKEPEVYSAIGNRREFGRLCEVMGYKTAVEVGVDCGIFARVLLETSSMTLYGVDPYLPYPEVPFDRGEALRLAALNLDRFGDRYVPVRMPSAEAAKKIDSVDFVYIDGAHDYDSVVTDLISWYPVVRPGGMMAGHDYDLPPVRSAVDRFAQLLNVQISVVPAAGDSKRLDESGGWAHPSFYFIKGQP